MSDISLVMQGLLSEFSLVDVLQVVGMSRQFTTIELKLSDGQHYGTIWLKSGRVVGARRGLAQGRAAFYEMFGAAPAAFVVARHEDPAQFPAPLGPLALLLIEAHERLKHPTAPPPARGSQIMPAVKRET